jgi:Spy/CpxP family protein refolding chaperone
MNRRTMIGLVAAAVAGTAVTGAGAFALAGHRMREGGMREGMMRRMATAMIDDALDTAHVTPEQRETIHATRDRLFALMEEHRRTRRARLDEMLAAFEGEPLDTARLQALRQEVEAQHARLADAIGQALGEIHAALTPDQRKALADYVRAHRHPRHW